MKLISDNFICFSDRKKLEQKFTKYCEEKHIPKTLFSLISFLQKKELLNRENVKEFLKLGDK